MSVQTGASGERDYSWPSPDRSVQQKFFSVTTIIDAGIPKPQLKLWAAKMTAEWSVDNLAAIEAILRKPVAESFRPIPLERVAEHARKDGTIDPRKLSLLVDLARDEAADPAEIAKARDDAIDLAKGAHRRINRRAKLRGSHVHDAIEAYHLGKPYPGVPDEVLDQYRQFLRFLDEHRPIVEQTEATVFNRERGYAGRLDSIMLYPSLAKAIQQAGLWEPSEDAPWPRVMVDVKTSGTGVYPEVALQMSAYSNAEFIGAPDGSEVPMPKVHAAVCLWLPEGRDYELRPVRIADDVYRSFLYAYEIMRWSKEIAREAIKDAVPRPNLSDPAAEFERLRLESPELLRALVGSHRFDTVRANVDHFTPDELALAIVWDRLTPKEILRYAPERPCPTCGWEVEKVRHRNAHTPKWKCTNDGCTGGKDGQFPWASWDTNPPEFAQRPGQTPYLQPKVKPAQSTGSDSAPSDEDPKQEAPPEQAQLTGVDGGGDG